MLLVLTHSSEFQSQIWEPDLDAFDNTVPLMVLIIKLTSFAWCVHDGTIKESNLSPTQIQNKINEFPSLLEYLGYVFYFPGFMVGPAFEFQAYRQFTRNQAPFDKMPSRLIPTLKCVGSAFICMFLYMNTFSLFNLEGLVKSQVFASGTWYRG